MNAQSRKMFLILVSAGIFLGGIWASTASAVNISEFVTLRPYVEIGGGYDDNVFEISEDAPLPEDAKERDDTYVDARAGVNADIHLDQNLLNLDLGLSYEFVYLKYNNNTQLDDTQNNLTFDFSLGSQYDYEKGFFRDRVKLSVQDVLELVPIDEEEPLAIGNQTLKNDFSAGVKYNVLAKPRTALILGYSYGRTDYGDDEITVWTVADDYNDSQDLTQESQTHTGTVDFKHAVSSKLTYVLSYAYEFADREETPGELNSANFARQNVITGVDMKLSPRIQTSLRAGYSLTSYEDVETLSQNDQDSFVAQASVTGKFEQLPATPLVTVGYERYYTENDFGDTLLTDDAFGRIAFKIAQGFVVNVETDYLFEQREVYDDDTGTLLFGVNGEYEVIKNMRLLAGYTFRDKEMFAQNFLGEDDRDETANIFSAGLEYKVARYVLLRGIYSYTDKSSSVAADEYSKNKFVASGRVIF